MVVAHVRTGTETCWNNDEVFAIWCTKKDYRMTPTFRHFDTIVIGVGGMGSAICYQLAQRGKRVLGL